MGDALVFQITQSYRPQLPQGQALQIRPGAVQSLPQDIAVHRRRQEIHALSLRQHDSQVRGGHIHHAGDGEGEDPGLGICPVQIVPLNGEQLLRVRLRSAEGGNPRQGQNLLRFVPGLDGEEHVRAHQQPQLVLRVPLLQLGQGVGGIAPPRPLQLQIQYLDPVPQAQLLPRQAGHLKPLFRSGAARWQRLVGWLPVRDQQQQVQLQQLEYRPGRGHMAQVGRVERPAVNADLHTRFLFMVQIFPPEAPTPSRHPWR